MPRYRTTRVVYHGNDAHPPGATVELTEAEAAALPAGSVTRLGDAGGDDASGGDASSGGGKAGGRKAGGGKGRSARGEQAED